MNATPEILGFYCKDEEIFTVVSGAFPDKLESIPAKCVETYEEIFTGVFKAKLICIGAVTVWEIADALNVVSTTYQPVYMFERGTLLFLNEEDVLTYSRSLKFITKLEALEALLEDNRHALSYYQEQLNYYQEIHEMVCNKIASL